MRIEISVPPEELEKNAAKRALCDQTAQFKKAARVPVVCTVSYQYLMRARRAPMADYFNNPRTQIEHQLLNLKWRAEHIHDDCLIPAEKVTLRPDLQTVRGGYFPVSLLQADDELPRTAPLLKSVEDIKRLEIPQPHENIYGFKLKLYEQMRELAPQYTLTLNGQPLRIDVTVGGAGGPFPDAFALAGGQIFEWMYTDPELVHELMEKVTTAFINYEHHVRKLTGRDNAGLGMGCDAAEMLSAEFYKEFVVPYYQRCYNEFPGHRSFHMCGKIDHLLELIANDLKINELNGFGSVTSPQRLREVMGGRVHLIGGVDIAYLLDGPLEAIKQDCRKYLSVFADCGGYTLQDGNNVAPGTPVEHLHAMVAAAREFV